MSTTEILDYRRYDQRRYIYQPYWISSSEISAVDSDDLAALAFSFPAASYGNSHILIEKVACQIIEGFVGGTLTVDIGLYTLATNDVTTGGVATVVQTDDLIPTADITMATPATYFALTGDWITAKLLKTELTPVIIVPADATVPCVVATIAANAPITAGTCRLHMMVTEVPLAA
jgi:hypothetical protein